MNNITAGGIDPRTGQPFAYYETMGGGMGARPGLDGLSGVHTHMSNTLNTPVEALEYLELVFGNLVVSPFSFLREYDKLKENQEAKEV